MTVKKPVKKPANKKKTTTTRKRKHQTPPVISAVLKTLPPPPPEPTEIEGLDGLTDRQRVFVEQYLRCWNATEAARRAGYSNPDHSGYENRLKPQIKEAIDKRLAEHKLSADEVLARLSDMATSTMGDFISSILITEEDIPRALTVIDLDRARDAGKLHLIKKVNITKDGMAIELYDAKAALELLGKHYELFSENKPADRELTVTVTNYNEMLEKAYGHRRRS